MQRRIREQSEAVKGLIARGREVAPGEVIGYAELDRIAGVDVRHHRHLLRSAFHRLLKDNDIVFGCIEMVGYKRLLPEEIPTVMTAGARRISRLSQVNLRKGEVATLSYDDLPPEQQVELNAAKAILGSLAQFSSPAMMRATLKHFRNDDPPTFPSNPESFDKS